MGCSGLGWGIVRSKQWADDGLTKPNAWPLGAHDWPQQCSTAEVTKRRRRRMRSGLAATDRWPGEVRWGEVRRCEVLQGVARNVALCCLEVGWGGTVRRCLCSRTTAWLENEAVFGRGCNNAPVSKRQRGVGWIGKGRGRWRERKRKRGRGESRENLQHYSVSVIAALRPSISAPARSAAPYSDCPSSCCSLPPLLPLSLAGWQTGPAAAPGRCLATASSRIEDKLFRFAFSVSALKLYRVAGMQM